MSNTLKTKKRRVLKTKFFVKSDIGKSREKNEDAFLVHEPKSKNKKLLYGSLYAVADGVGGYSRGDYASKLALKVINDTYYSQPPDIDPVIKLKNAILKANEIIYQDNLKKSENNRMSTTVVVAIILGKKAIIANVGDSRAYIINKKGIRQITRDHSLVDEQVRAGIITKEEAKRSRYRNIITRSIGGERDVEVDFYTVNLNNGDNILLTTDGLTRVVDDSEIYKKVIMHSPEKSVKSLIDLANKRGGPDNITVCLVKIGGVSPMVIAIPSILILLSILLIFLFKPPIGVKTGTLIVESEPKEAKVYINEAYKGLTPLKTYLNIGEYNLKLVKENYKEREEKIKIEENKETTLKITLEPISTTAKKGSLEVYSTPNKAKVYINNKYKGDTPLKLDLDVGTYSLKISKSGYQDYTDKITIEENKVLKISPKLSSTSSTTPTTEKIGYLTLDSNPQGADVYVNDKNIGKTPIKRYELNKGTYTLRIKKGGYLPYSLTVQIKEDKEYKETINLSKKLTLKLLSDWKDKIEYLVVNNNNNQINFRNSIEIEWRIKDKVTVDFYKDKKKISSLKINIKENNINEIKIPFGIYEDNKTKIYVNGDIYDYKIGDIYDYKIKIKDKLTISKSPDNKYLYLNDFYDGEIKVIDNKYNNITFKITVYKP